MIALLLLLLQAQAQAKPEAQPPPQPFEALDWVDRTACPVWEPCGDGGARCWWRAQQLQKDAACFDELTAMACEAGQPDACLRQDLASQTGAGRIHAYLKAIGGDLTRDRGRFLRPELLVLLGLLFLMKAVLLRQMGWRSRLVAARDALMASIASAPIVLLALGEFDKLAWWGPAIAWAGAVIIEWLVLRKLEPGPMHSAFGAAAGTNTMAGLVALALAVSWSKWGPQSFEPRWDAVRDTFREASRHIKQQSRAVALGAAAVVVVESILLRLLRWGSFPRSIRDSAFMNVLALPVGAAAFLAAGTLLPRSFHPGLAVALATGWMLAILLKWGVLSAVAPDAIHRPGVAAFLSTTLTVILGVGAALLLH